MRRRFYLVYVAAAAACAALAIDAWAVWLTPDESPRGRVRPPVATSAPAVARDKDGAALASRNMFCSSCDGLVSPPPGGEPVRSTLPLELIATHTTGDERAFATIRHRESRRVGAYRAGDAVEGGVIERVAGSFAVVRNTATDRLERIDLIATATATTDAPQVSAAGAAPSDELDEGIARISDTEYEVDRDLIRAVMANPNRVKGARVALRPDGVRLFAVRASSPLAKIGLRNGDTVVDVNGMAPTSADKLLEIYAALSDANRIGITVRRGGRDVKLSYTIR